MNETYQANAASGEAWREYLETLDVSRQRVLSDERCRTEDDRSRSVYRIQMLAATAFNMYIAPRRTHPSFYIHPVFMPFEVAWGHPCPDILYRWAFIGGANTYRVWGQLGTTPWSEIQVMNGFWGDAKYSNVANVTLADHAGPDGTFEIVFSPDPQPGSNWVEIPRDAPHIVLQSREIWSDWENEIGLKMLIEPLHLVDEPEWSFSEAEMNQRLREAAQWVKYNVDYYIKRTAHVLETAPGMNRFATEFDGNPNLGFSGGVAQALKARMMYDLEPGEVMVIDVEKPRAIYWSLCVADLWWQTTEYSYHQSSLNAHQAVADADGRVRFVLAHEDPGVPNWIDVVGVSRGLAHLRSYVPLDGYEPDPVVTKMKANELRAFLPAATPTILPQERSEILKRRARASLARYGY